MVQWKFSNNINRAFFSYLARFSRFFFKIDQIPMKSYFLTKKMVKNGEYKNENLVKFCDPIEVR